jgi:hypothetical protein
VTAAPDIAAAVNSAVPYVLPARLAGRPRATSTGGVAGVAGYGAGLSTFVVLPLPGRVGYRTMNAAARAGAAPAPLPDTEGYEMASSVVTTVVFRVVGEQFGRRTFLLAGLVSRDLLRAAAAELLARIRQGEL